MPTSTWGPYTWNMFHTLSQKLNTNNDSLLNRLIHERAKPPTNAPRQPTALKEP